MEIITIESGIWQELTDRIKNIERYVKDTAQPATISDEEFWVDNDQAMRILCVAKRTLQQYRSDGKLPYKRFGRQIRYRLSDIEAFSGMSLKTLSQKNLTNVRKECMAQNRQVINQWED